MVDSASDLGMDPSNKRDVGAGSKEGVVNQSADGSSEDGGWSKVTNRKARVPIGDKGKGIHMGSRVPAGRLNDRAKIQANWRKPGMSSSLQSRSDGRKSSDRRYVRPSVDFGVRSVNLGASKVSWVDVCENRRKFSNSFAMTFVKPVLDLEGVRAGKLTENLLNDVAARWENTLVGYVLGDVPFFSQIRAWANRMWRIDQGVKIFSRENGYFFFKFDKVEDCIAVLHGGPWMFDGQLVVLQRWKASLSFDRDLLTAVPVWVQFPQLPLSLWSLPILNVLASVIGIPICLDRATAYMERLSYARCLVEIAAELDPPDFVTALMDDGASMKVAIKYEGIPSRCSLCVCFGHSTLQCPSSKADDSSKNDKDVAAQIVKVRTLKDGEVLGSGVNDCNGKLSGGIDCMMGEKCAPVYEEVAVSTVNVAVVGLVDVANCKKSVVMPIVPDLNELNVDGRVEDNSEDEDGGDADQYENVCKVGCNVGLAESTTSGSEENGVDFVIPNQCSTVTAGDERFVMKDLLAASSMGTQVDLDVKKTAGANVDLAVEKCKVGDTVTHEDNGGVVNAARSSGISLISGRLPNSERDGDLFTLGSKLDREGLVDFSQSEPSTISSASLSSGFSTLSCSVPIDVGLPVSCLVSNPPNLGTLHTLNLLNNELRSPPRNPVGSIQVLQNDQYAVVADPVQPSSSLISSMNCLNSPVLTSFSSGLILPVFHSPTPQEDSNPSLISTALHKQGDGVLGSVGMGMGSEMNASVEEGFQVGVQVLMSHEKDSAESFKYTKINESWLLEQEEAKMCSFKSKKSSSSKVVENSIGTRKSVRFVGGSGPTPPARFRK